MGENYREIFPLLTSYFSVDHQVGPDQVEITQICEGTNQNQRIVMARTYSTARSNDLVLVRRSPRSL